MKRISAMIESINAMPLATHDNGVRCDVMTYASARKTELRAMPRRFAIAAGPNVAQVQDTCKKWSQGHLERKRLGIEGAWQLVHVEDVLAKATDVLAHVGAEARDQTRGNGLAVFGHGRKRLRQVCDVG
jgi:hypothetical protein